MSHDKIARIAVFGALLAVLAGCEKKKPGAAPDRDTLQYLPPGAAVLDLGAGTGAASLACVLRGAGKVDLVDRSSRALRDARAILEGAGATEVRAVGATLEDPRGWPVRDRYDVVVLGFSLLEAAREDERLAGAIIDAAAGRVADGGWLLVLDSAQRPRARVLNGLRPRLLEAGLRLWAPCPHALPCPALERPRDFCHAARAWDLPEDLARVRAEGRLSDDRLTYAFLLAGRAPPPSLRVTARVMGDVQQEKGRARLAVCTATDVRELVALKRHRDAYAGLTSLARGDALGLTLPQGGGPAWRVEDAAVLEPVVSS